MRSVLLAALIISLVPAASVSEPVRFEDPLVSEGVPFSIYYPDGYGRMARRVEKIIVDEVPVLAGQLGLGSIDSMELYIAPGRDEYLQLYSGTIPEWSEACSNPARMSICVNADAVLKSSRPLRIVIKHELSHLLMAQRVKGTPIPRWFMEGVAMIQSEEWSISDQWEFLMAIWEKDCPLLENLDDRFPPGNERTAYMVSYFAVRELLSVRENDLVTVTAFTRDLRNFRRGFFLTFGETPVEFSARVDVIIRDKYRNVLFLAASAPFWSAMVLLFLAAYLLKRHRSRRKLREWEEEEKDLIYENGVEPQAK